MQSQPSTEKIADNGGRRRIRDRRFLVSTPPAYDRRTNWERRSGYDRRLKQIEDYPQQRRSDEA